MRMCTIRMSLGIPCVLNGMIEAVSRMVVTSVRHMLMMVRHSRMMVMHFYVMICTSKMLVSSCEKSVSAMMVLLRRMPMLLSLRLMMAPHPSGNSPSEPLMPNGVTRVVRRKIPMIVCLLPIPSSSLPMRCCLPTVCGCSTSMVCCMSSVLGTTDVRQSDVRQLGHLGKVRGNLLSKCRLWCRSNPRFKR
jgi:hypothetical protein